MAGLFINAHNYIRYHTLKNRNDPYGYFYLAPKIHKSWMTTRPVCSDCKGIAHPLGKWLDIPLQTIVKSQPAYFQDLFSLKLELNDLRLPPNASLFTFNAITIYTNINIVNCI
jgi:hypothetical protein